MDAIRIYLVRHARAEKDAPRGDAARRLTAEGRREFDALLARLGDRLRLARIVTSPFTRAVETAERLARATGASLVEDVDLTSGRSSGPEILRTAARAGGGAALVGHNPEIAEAIAAAGGGGLAVRPGTIAAVELDGAGARLLWLESPEE